METLAPVFTYRHAFIHLATRYSTEFIDLTEPLAELIAAAGVRVGILNIQTLHTTTAVLINENEPLLLTDFRALLETVAPCDGRYHHDDAVARTVNVTEAERPNGHAHCRALLLPTTAHLNVADGRLVLGPWQRVFFVELDGPRDRDISVLTFGESGQ